VLSPVTGFVGASVTTPSGRSEIAGYRGKFSRVAGGGHASDRHGRCNDVADRCRARRQCTGRRSGDSIV